MSINFTVKNKKSLNFQYKDQDDLSLSSTIGGESVDITINQPQVFDASKTTITDAKVLEDIVKDANLRYSVDEAKRVPGKTTPTSSLPSGTEVRYWNNVGTDEGMDLIQPWSYPVKPGTPDEEIHCPIWDKGGVDNPFTAGAFKFSIDQTDTNYIDELVFSSPSADIREENRYVRSHKYFYFGKYKEDYTLPTDLANDKPGGISEFKNFSTGSGPYTMYAVYSQSGVAGDQTYFSPLWTPLLGYGEDADATNPVSQSGKVLQTYENAFFHDPSVSAENFTFTLKDGSRPRTTGPTTGSATAHNATRFQYPTTQSISSGEVQIYVFTYTGTTDDKFSFFDIDSKGVVNEKKGVGSLSGEGGGTYCNVFGAPERMAYRFKVGSLSDVEYKPAYNGNSIFVAEFGYFNKALDGQTASTLCRLLREKYKVD